MKILLNVRDLSTGGAERVAILLARGFQHLGHTVIVVSCMTPKLTCAPLPEGAKLISMNVHKPLMQANALASVVNREKPDAVIAFGINLLIGAALSRLRWRSSCPLIFRNENNLALEWQQANLPNRIVGPTISRLAARCAHVIAVSRSLAPATASFLRIAPEQVTTILNPVIDDTASPINAEEATLHPWLKATAIPAFVAMGRLEPQKGFDVLIAAFSQVRRQSNARLVIFGEGSLHDVLQAQIDALHLQEAIVLAGYTDNPMVQMGTACAFVLSSRFEGFGLVLVEALLAGTRVISTNCDFGPAEILEDGRYGTLVPVGDQDALANAMLTMLHQSPPTQRPPEAWFEQFTATEAARQHVALIEALHEGLPNS